MHTLKPWFLGVFLGCLFVGTPQSFAEHVAEDEVLALYLELNVPVCVYAKEFKTMNSDCKTPVPAVFECWKTKIDLDYDTAMFFEFLEEVKKSNQRYQYYNEPFYNELFSNRNWDNLMDYADQC